MDWVGFERNKIYDNYWGLLGNRALDTVLDLDSGTDTPGVRCDRSTPTVVYQFLLTLLSLLLQFIRGLPLEC